MDHYVVGIKTFLAAIGRKMYTYTHIIFSHMYVRV